MPPPAHAPVRNRNVTTVKEAIAFSFYLKGHIKTNYLPDQRRKVKQHDPVVDKNMVINTPWIVYKHFSLNKNVS